MYLYLTINVRKKCGGAINKKKIFFLIFKFSSNLRVFKLVMLHVEPYYLSFTKKWI